MEKTNTIILWFVHCRLNTQIVLFGCLIMIILEVRSSEMKINSFDNINNVKIFDLM